MHRQASVGEAELAEGVDAGEHVDVVTVRVDAAQLDQRVVERHRLRVELLLHWLEEGLVLSPQALHELALLERRVDGGGGGRLGRLGQDRRPHAASGARSGQVVRRRRGPARRREVRKEERGRHLPLLFSHRRDSTHTVNRCKRRERRVCWKRGVCVKGRGGNGARRAARRRSFSISLRRSVRNCGSVKTSWRSAIRPGPRCAWRRSSRCFAGCPSARAFSSKASVGRHHRVPRRATLSIGVTCSRPRPQAALCSLHLAAPCFGRAAAAAATAGARRGRRWRGGSQPRGALRPSSATARALDARPEGRRLWRLQDLCGFDAQVLARGGAAQVRGDAARRDAQAAACLRRRPL